LWRGSIASRQQHDPESAVRGTFWTSQTLPFIDVDQGRHKYRRAMSIMTSADRMREFQRAI
jgi:hypothetical protein